MFETHYNEEMAAEVRRVEAAARATAAGHPEWRNACSVCGCELSVVDRSCCEQCLVNRQD